LHSECCCVAELGSLDSGDDVRRLHAAAHINCSEQDTKQPTTLQELLSNRRVAGPFVAVIGLEGTRLEGIFLCLFTFTLLHEEECTTAGLCISAQGLGATVGALVVSRGLQSGSVWQWNALAAMGAMVRAWGWIPAVWMSAETHVTYAASAVGVVAHFLYGLSCVLGINALNCLMHSRLASKDERMQVITLQEQLNQFTGVLSKALVTIIVMRADKLASPTQVLAQISSYLMGVLFFTQCACHALLALESDDTANDPSECTKLNFELKDVSTYGTISSMQESKHAT